MDIFRIENATGIALLITAAGTFIVSVGTIVLQFLTFRAGILRDAKINILHTMVDGQSEKLNKAIEGKAYGEGHAAGMTDERADPHAPASSNP